MSAPVWSGSVVRKARAWMVTRLPAACGRCGQPVQPAPATGWVVGHIKDRATHPELTMDPLNWQPEHRACSDAGGQAAVIAKARAAGAQEAIAALSGADFPHQTSAEQSPPLPKHTHQDRSAPTPTRAGLSWAELCQAPPSWLSPFLELPDDASPPLWVSGVHPEAVGSYGPAAIEWMEANVVERGRPLRLRWWQRLAIVLQLQHREDGTLCWRVVVESGPRRIGKSVRLRGMALWRLQHGGLLFEPEQLVLHTGKDLAIVREVMRKAWAWAAPREDWDLKRGMTEPEVSYLETNRWVARSKDSTTGYDACLALCDEAWDVAPASIDDDLEPTMLERESPQLVLTSTAHRRATSLMRGRIAEALSVDDGETMLLIWSAPDGADESDPAVWRAASPHWSADRERMMASKYAKALAGEVDPEADDLDPMAGFRAQYLNVWQLRERRQVGTALATADDWAALAGESPDSGAPRGTPAGVAIESWPGAGVTVAAAWRLEDDQVQVSTTAHLDVASAVAAARALGARSVVVGASLASDPAFKGMRTEAKTATVVAAVADLARWMAEGALVHDGGEHLAEQVTSTRTKATSTGMRVTSAGPADAIKAAAWAIGQARTRKATGRPRIILPSAS